MENQCDNYKFLSVIADAIANHPLFSHSLEHVKDMLDMEASKYYKEELEAPAPAEGRK